MARLNENEQKALNAILDTCDDLNGDKFTRLHDLMLAVMREFDNNGHIAGGYVSSLINKGVLDIDEDDGYGVGVWVNA